MNKFPCAGYYFNYCNHLCATTSLSFIYHFSYLKTWIVKQSSRICALNIYFTFSLHLYIYTSIYVCTAPAKTCTRHAVSLPWNMEATVLNLPRVQCVRSWCSGGRPRFGSRAGGYLSGQTVWSKAGCSCWNREKTSSDKLSFSHRGVFLCTSVFISSVSVCFSCQSATLLLLLLLQREKGCC